MCLRRGGVQALSVAQAARGKTEWENTLCASLRRQLQDKGGTAHFGVANDNAASHGIGGMLDYRQAKTRAARAPRAVFARSNLAQRILMSMVKSHPVPNPRQVLTTKP